MNRVNDFYIVELNDSAMNAQAELDVNAIERLQYLCNWVSVVEEIRLRTMLEDVDSK